MGPDLNLIAKAIAYIGVVVRKWIKPFKGLSGLSKGLAKPDEWIGNDRVTTKPSEKSSFLGYSEPLSLCQCNHWPAHAAVWFYQQQH